MRCTLLGTGESIVRHHFALIVATAVLSVPSVQAQSQSITLNSRSLPAVRQQLRTGPPPDVVIQDALILTQPEVWIVRSLRLQGNGVVYLQQFDLDLTIQRELQLTTFVKPLFVSFPPNSRAKDGRSGDPGAGAVGGAGEPGLNAGTLTLRLPPKAPSRIMPVDLEGQSGGNGGSGGSGAPGRAGAAGRASASGVFNCVQAGTSGAPGERGGDGGEGGPGGACGRGGTLRVDHEHVVQVMLVSLYASAGRGGNGGAPGPGGAGGQGGVGGSFCSGASSGRPGDPGVRGKPGLPGADCIQAEKVDLTPPSSSRKKK
jgi:hypothetical protein